MFDYAKSAKERGLKVIIAGAGGAAHLPGMVASITVLPVIRCACEAQNHGWT
jgi:5-(carboxyamino)imidazole ribonucleotide mutase